MPNENQAKLELSHETVEQAMKTMREHTNPMVKAAMEKLFDGVVNKGLEMKDALGMKPEMLESLYSHAYFLYNGGRYDDAVLLFQILMLLHPTEAKYTMGLAACLHMKKSYFQAGEMYALAGILGNDNPIPYYHAADCWMNVDQPNVAVESLKLAIKLSGERPEYAVIKDRCTMTLQALQKGKKGSTSES